MPSGPRRMLGSRISAAVVLHSCQPRPAPVIAGVMTDLPPLSGSHVTPSRLYARCTPSSPFRVKYENRNALGSAAGAGGGDGCPHATSAIVASAPHARVL